MQLIQGFPIPPDPMNIVLPAATGGSAGLRRSPYPVFLQPVNGSLPAAAESDDLLDLGGIVDFGQGSCSVRTNPHKQQAVAHLQQMERQLWRQTLLAE